LPVFEVPELEDQHQKQQQQRIVPQTWRLAKGLLTVPIMPAKNGKLIVRSRT
jgi:hypothetical protein